MLRRRLGALRVAGRIARRDLRHARGRTALVAALVGLPVLAGAVLATLSQSSQVTPARYAQQMLGDTAQAWVSGYYGAEVLQSPDGRMSSSSGDGGAAPDIAEYEAQLRALLPPTATLVRVVVGEVTLDTGERAVRTPVEAAEEPADPAVASRHHVTAGALPSRSGEVALAERVADTLGVGPGDTVAVTHRGQAPVDVVVSGLLGPQSTGADVVARPGTIFPTPQVAEAWAFERPAVGWYVLGPDPVTWAGVVGLNDVGSTVLSRAVVLDPPDPSEVGWEAFDSPAPDRDQVIAVAAGVAAIGLLEAVLLVGPAFAVGVRRSERQLALLAATGAERRTLRHVVLVSGVTTAVAASVVGAAAGVLVAAGIRLVTRVRGDVNALPDLRVPWLVLAGMVGIGVLVAATAAWLPARRAGRVDVVAALEGRRVEAPVRRRVPITGVALMVLGLTAAMLGAAQGSMPAMVAGILGLELGVIAISGVLVVAAARLAPRLGVAGRLALRDAARHRSRTAPAVAAVIAAVAGMLAAAIYVEAESRAWASQYRPIGPDGTVAVTYVGDVDVSALRASSEAALRALPVTDVAPVTFLAPAEPDGQTEPGGEAEPGAAAGSGDVGSMAALTVEITPPRALECDPPQVPSADGGCSSDGWWTHAAWFSAGSPVLVDDGTVLAVLGAPDAAPALRAGRVVVPSERDLWSDGTVHLEIVTYGDDGQGGPARTVVLPAAAATFPTAAAELVVPPSVLDRLGLEAHEVGLVAATSRVPTDAELATATARADVNAELYVERGAGSPGNAAGIALLVAALVVAVAACGITVALALTDARPDLATMAAVGAGPRVRRRVAAAQAGVVACLGVVVGVATGLALGAVLVTARNGAPDAEGTWAVVVPWASVAAAGIGLPVLAVAGAWALTRSRLPMVRRLAV